MTSSILCTGALFMKDTENVQNYCKAEVEPNSILPRAYHIIDGLWFIASQNTLTFTVVYPQKHTEVLMVSPPLGIIKLYMYCTGTSSYLTLLPYYSNESKSIIQGKCNIQWYILKYCIKSNTSLPEEGGVVIFKIVNSVIIGHSH